MTGYKMQMPEKAETLSHALGVEAGVTSGTVGETKHTKMQAIGKTFGALCG